MSDNDLELGEEDSEETIDGFPPPERTISTQPYDLSIQTLKEQWDADILVLPDIQREYVWDKSRASRLIESLLLNIPIPVLYFAETTDAKYEIIDGHQRVETIVRFLNNEFPLTGLYVLLEYRGKKFRDLPSREQRFLRTRSMRTIIISANSHPNMKFEVFERLNTGSIALNAQELRNSIYRGPFNRTLHELVHNTRLRACIGTKMPRRRMVDEELLLRFFALSDTGDGRAAEQDKYFGLSEYRPPLKTFLNAYMRRVVDADQQTRQQLTARFMVAISRLETALGGTAFRITDKAGNPIDRTINRALFDAQMLTFLWLSTDLSEGESGAIRANLGKLYEDGAFLDSIRRATGDRSRLLTRVKGVARALEEASFEIVPPVPLSMLE